MKRRGQRIEDQIIGEEDKVKVLILDNCSTDSTKSEVEKFTNSNNYFHYMKNESNIDLKELYLAILLVVIQVFSDGNHRSAKYYLQLQNIKISDKLFYNLVDDFRNYSNLDGGEISQSFNINKTNNFAKKYMSSLTSFIKKEYPNLRTL